MSTMIKFRRDGHEGEFVCMKIVNRKFKIGEIWLKADDLLRYTGKERTMDLRDGDDYITLYPYSEDVTQIRVTHVCAYSTGEIYGRRVNLFVKTNDLFKIATGVNKLSVLSHEPAASPKLEWHSRRALHNAVSDPRSRNALRKYLRFAFQWNGAKAIRLYDDGEKSFYFEEICAGNTRGICGGLIFHVGKDRKGNPRYTYALHT